MRPQVKVLPVERTQRARPSRWPVADVGARQPLQRAFTALAVRRKEHPLSDGNLREVYHNWRRRAIRQQQFVNVSQRDKCRPLPALRTGMKILIGKRWARTGNVSASRRARGRQNKPGEGRNCRTDHASWRDGFQDYYAVKSHLSAARRLVAGYESFARRACVAVPVAAASSSATIDYYPPAAFRSEVK